MLLKFSFSNTLSATSQVTSQPPFVGVAKKIFGERGNVFFLLLAFLNFLDDFLEINNPLFS